MVSKEREKAETATAIAEKIQKECEEILSIALPDLEGAIEALRTLKRDDIVEIRTMSKPPELIKMTMECVAIFLGERPIRCPDLNDRNKMI